MHRWALQDAKARFSAVVDRACRVGPQLVTRRGTDVVVVMATRDFDELTGQRGGADLAAFLRESPLAELPPETLERVRDTGREVEL